MALMDLGWLTLSEVASEIHTQRASAREVLDAVRERIERTEPRVHAFAGLMLDSAYAEAAAADEEIAAGKVRGPLHGVPVAVKDLLYTSGFPTRGGSEVLEDFVPDYDATVVKKFKAAGAVLVGKTVTHEFAYGQNIPPTRNAWDQSCYPGGSSAGSGVALAVGSVFGAIGTDTGGSVRAPSAVNGIVGLKPTHGRVGLRGVLPMSPTLDTAGPMARTVKDCALVLSVVAGPDPDDRSAANEPVPDYAAGLDRDLTGLRIGIEREYFFYAAVNSEVADAVWSAVAVIEGLGATIVDVEIPNLDYSIPAGLSVLLGDTSEWHQYFIRRVAGRYVRETRAMLELGEMALATTYVRAQKVRNLVRASYRQAFEENDLVALLAPSCPVTTMPVEQLSVDLTGSGETALSSILHHGFPANVIGVPALSVPVGFDHQNLPIAMQLMGRPFGESALFRIGDAFQGVTDWHDRHPDWIAAV